MKNAKARPTFEKNINEINLLLNLTMGPIDESVQNAIIKAAVVGLVSYWERFIEDLIIEGSAFIAEALRNPIDLPNHTKQQIALTMVSENKEKNPKAFSDAIWGFSGDGWANQYKNFSQQKVSSFNTANLSNIKMVMWDVFGIRDVFESISSQNPKTKDIQTKISMVDFIITKRHLMAHGASASEAGVDKVFLLNSITIFVELMSLLDTVVWEEISQIVEVSAHSYSLKTKYFFEIMELFRINGYSTVTNKDFQKISQGANSNHNKLAYSPWGLLEIENLNKIKPTKKLIDFIEGRITLPEKIGVLKNQASFPKRDTASISYEDLKSFY